MSNHNDMEYEVHITIECDDISRFKNDCKYLGIKPIIIETENDSEYLTQVMTSSKHRGEEYQSTLKTLSTNLNELGFKVKRMKVEKLPEKLKDADFIYYETHLRLRLKNDFDRNILLNLCKRLNFHLSRNLLKKTEEYYYQMITYRNSDISLPEFKDIITEAKNELEYLGLEYDKVEIEECIFDTNVSIDNKWINKKENLLMEIEEIFE